MRILDGELATANSSREMSSRSPTSRGWWRSTSPKLRITVPENSPMCSAGTRRLPAGRAPEPRQDTLYKP